jgi:hypothetical protein
MAVINVQQAVQPILGAMLDYLSILLVFVLIYMLFKLVAGDKSVGDLFSSDRGDDGRPESERKRKRREKKEREEEEEEEKTGKPTKRPKGLDNEHPGRIRILVTNVDTPIADAAVTIFALDTPLWRRALNRQTKQMIIYHDRTGPDGCCPSRPRYKIIGSGPIKIKVKSRYGDAVYEAVVLPFAETNEVQEIQVPVKGRGEHEEAFEPHVDDVKFTDRSLILTGRVI